MFASRLQILDRAKTWAFPPDCLRCGDRVEIPFGLCGPCWAEARFIGKSCCHTCGDELIGEEAAQNGPPRWVGRGSPFCQFGRGAGPNPAPW
ncbi:double zinc ribbon domain-containing protein [Roseobacter sp. HKCC-CH-9208]|uniref:double zinc ribbon domain-containing protein n=1 Tax=Roseobacter sp. HKCC-CH-9208 TaxID=3120339 RepID=UPI0030EE79DE